MHSTRAHLRDLITAGLLMAFLATMAPGIDRSLTQIGDGVQSIQAHAGLNASAGGVAW